MEEKKVSFGRIPKRMVKGFGRLMGRGGGMFSKSGRSIRTKILLALMALALIPILILGVTAYITGSNAIMDKSVPGYDLSLPR